MLLILFAHAGDASEPLTLFHLRVSHLDLKHEVESIRVAIPTLAELNQSANGRYSPNYERSISGALSQAPARLSKRDMLPLCTYTNDLSISTS